MITLIKTAKNYSFSVNLTKDQVYKNNKKVTYVKFVKFVTLNLNVGWPAKITLDARALFEIISQLLVGSFSS